MSYEEEWITDDELDDDWLEPEEEDFEEDEW